MKILWVSRHKMSEKQYQELGDIYGKNVELKVLDHTIRDVKEIIDAAEDCEIIAVVLSIGMLDKLFEANNRRKTIIQAVSKRVLVENQLTEKGETQYEYVHDYWEEIAAIQFKTKKLMPNS